MNIIGKDSAFFSSIFMHKIQKLSILKTLIVLCLVLIILNINKAFLLYNINLNESYYTLQKTLNLSFNNKLFHKIRIGIYTYCIKNGGRARITSVLINYLYKIKIFQIFLYTKEPKEDNEYELPNNVKRKKVTNNIIDTIMQYQIDILIYQLSNEDEINELNNLKNIKVIY